VRASLIRSANPELAVAIVENKVAAAAAIMIFFMMLSLIALNRSRNSVQFQFSVIYLSAIRTSTARSPSQPTLASPREKSGAAQGQGAGKLAVGAASAAIPTQTEPSAKE
jgi:hypothetical protein|tara:strand:- start:159 stop:488 length:330 start_codon:yes stop_codon:yes gene_type:complete